MKFAFDSSKSLIRVLASVHGPYKMSDAFMALDTGATRTSISPKLLELAGYDLGRTNEYAELTTANGRIKIPLLPILALTRQRNGRTVNHT